VLISLIAKVNPKLTEMKIKRKLRKQMKLSEAMNILDLSRSGLRDQIFKYKRLNLAPRRGDNTTPIYVYAAEVERLAQEWGLM
jgi:hypothetical protein